MSAPVRLTAYGQPVERIQVCLHKDTPIYIPGSSTTDRQLDLWNLDAPGRFSRPRVFVDAVAISLDELGLAVHWKDGGRTQIMPAAIACWAISRYPA